MNYVSRLVEVALKEVGYHEKNNAKNLNDKTASNDGNKNYTKYARDFNTKYKGYFCGDKQGAEWCTTYLSWCFCQAFSMTEARKLLCVPSKDNYSASCKWAYKYFKNKKQISKKPSVGSQAFFGTSESDIHHTGLVYKVDSKKVYLVEGNKNNKVSKTSYAISNSKIYAYGVPKFDKEPEAEPIHYKVNVNSFLSLREKPSTLSKRLAKMYNGDDFYVDKIENGWAYGSFGSLKGYASAKYLKKV